MRAAPNIDQPRPAALAGMQKEICALQNHSISIIDSIIIIFVIISSRSSSSSSSSNSNSNSSSSSSNIIISISMNILL